MWRRRGATVRPAWKSCSACAIAATWRRRGSTRGSCRRSTASTWGWCLRGQSRCVAGAQVGREGGARCGGGACAVGHLQGAHVGELPHGDKSLLRRGALGSCAQAGRPSGKQRATGLPCPGLSPHCTSEFCAHVIRHCVQALSREEMVDHFSALLAALAGVCSSLLAVHSWEDLEGVSWRRGLGTRTEVFWG